MAKTTHMVTYLVISNDKVNDYIDKGFLGELWYINANIFTVCQGPSLISICKDKCVNMCSSLDLDFALIACWDPFISMVTG